MGLANGRADGGGGHVIMTTSADSVTSPNPLRSDVLETNGEFADELERATKLTRGEITVALVPMIQKIFFASSKALSHSRMFRPGKATAVPSPVFLAHCEKLIRKKFAEPLFGSAVTHDLNISWETDQLLFGARNAAFPVFFKNPAESLGGSDEVHLFLFETAIYHSRPDDTTQEHVSQICEFFLTQGYENDDTWVGIDHYADLFTEFKLDLPQAEIAKLPQIDQRATYFKDASTWTGAQVLIDDLLGQFRMAIAYRFFEIIGTKNAETGEINFKHDNAIKLGVPERIPAV